MKKDDYTIENFGLTCCYCGEIFYPKIKNFTNQLKVKEEFMDTNTIVLKNADLQQEEL